MMVKMTRTDRWYELTGTPAAMWGGSGMFRPDRAHAWQEPQGETPTVEVSGPRIIKATGKLSASRGKVLYGKFGHPLDAAPLWVQDIARAFPQGVTR